MTELENLQRAKLYMEKLANGINPLDGTVIPEDEVVNNVRLSRCFFYVADVLGQVINNGGVAQKKKPERVPFFLSEGQRAAVELSHAPIPVSELTKRINKLVDVEYMVKLNYDSVLSWLLSIGVLEEISVGAGRTTKRPTAQGRSLGVLTEQRVGRDERTYEVVLYNLDGQRFILDNLDGIVEFENQIGENRGKPWSREHDECLMDLYRNGMPIHEIAAALKRNSGSIRARIKKLGL